MANYHVTRDKESGEWKTRKENAERSAGYYDTQAEAERAAKKFSANTGGGEVVIHGLDGKIRDKDTVSPGNDPYPPRDLKH